MDYSFSFLILRGKVDRNAVYTMPLVLWIAKSLALENMSQVTSTVVAYNLRPHHAKTRVRLLSDGAWHGIPEGGPSAARVELVVCFVQRCVASGARVNARVGIVLVVCAGAGHLSTLLSEDAELLYGQVSKRVLMRTLTWTYQVIAVLATRPRASGLGSLCCPPYC